MRILLLLYYRATSTYALNVIAASLEGNKHYGNELSIILAKNIDDLLRTIDSKWSEFDKIIVGWSFYSTEYEECKAELGRIKILANYPNVIHILGGVHASAEPEQSLKAGFDLVALGEGEIIINEIINKTVNKEDIKNLPGIAHIENGLMRKRVSQDRVALDDYPPFAIKLHRYNPIEITRGCIYACSFCQTPFMFKAKFRHRSIENIKFYVNKMKEVGLKDIRFITPTSLSYGSSDESVNLDKVEELLSSVRDIIGSEGRIFLGSFPSEVRPEHVNHESLKLLKKYVNNDNIIIGAQTGSQKILDSSHRGHNVEDIIRAVRLTIEYGFIANVDFIFGMPEENEKDILQSMSLAEYLISLGARIHGHTFMPLPGTPWSKEKAGKLTPTALTRLNKMNTGGKLYGQWRQQETIAKTLENFQREKAK